ncbi:protein FAR-RED IMPAIRED RESPONSE 1-like [Coffea arabica]|uniref:Protein FAR1-RELATED SEQUENCE n=1 Tax=Coffea arabica TaxID=13443 RepID=A0A6P6SZ97_COFAR
MENDLPIHEVQSCRKLDFEDVDLQEINDNALPLCITDGNRRNQIFLPLAIPDDLVPKLDMEFDTEVAAKNFYQKYAKASGFGTRLSKGHKDKNSDLMLDRVFCCSREGKKPKDKRNMIVKCPRPETRCDCSARMKISCRQGEKYRVVQFVAEHNHELSTPSKTHLFRSHRHLTMAHEAEIYMARSCGITPKQSIELMSKQVGGRENLGFIRDDLKNYLRSKRSIPMMQGDTGGVLEYLQGMQLEDPNFFYAIQVDEDDLITNIFWADAKMRTDFAHFGDVVCFDTTYRKHKDGRPIALFVGVNHHKQTTVFGAALLYDETILTFEWLFDTFAKAMMGKIPRTILTDQDGRMATALASQWPTTYHRLCIWHIYQNAATHLADVFKDFQNFSTDFSHCIYDYENEDDFFEGWSEMLKTYGLEDNKWLKKMFDIKEKWALVYGRETFCADMTTTQRSESMNSVIKKYVSYKHGLLEFFEHFQRLLDDRRYNESVADFKGNQSTPAMTFPCRILQHAASVYTHEVYEKFKEELCKGIDCKWEVDGDLGNQMSYRVTPHGKTSHHLVTYDSSTNSICCSCKKFEFAGFLCSHALKILMTLNIVTIPDAYILKRWTKAAKIGNVHVSSESSPEMELKAKLSFRYKELSYLYMQLMTKASECDEAYQIAKDGFWKMLEQMDACCQGKKKMKEVRIEEHCSVYQDVDTNPSEIAYNKIKGIKVKEKVTYKSSKRPRSALEMATKKRKYKVKEKFSSKRLQELGNNVVNSSMDSATIQGFAPELPPQQGQELGNNDDSDQQVAKDE